MTKGIVLAERGLAGITDALVAVSPAVRDQLLGLGIGTPSKWHVIPLGLDPEPLRTSTVHRPQARTALGLPANGPLVGIVGRIAPIKDHETFPRAAAIVGRDHPDAVFVVAGDGPERTRVEAVAKHLVGDRVVFLGWIHDLPRLYAALDVVVLTSRNEGTPVALIEAMAAGRPVVATRVGGFGRVRGRPDRFGGPRRRRRGGGRIDFLDPGGAQPRPEPREEGQGGLRPIRAGSPGRRPDRPVRRAARTGGAGWPIAGLTESPAGGTLSPSQSGHPCPG